MAQNFYEILGVKTNASPAEISQAYRKLVMQNHPDRFKDPREKAAAEESLKIVTEAYNTLSNWKLRAEYDKGVSTPKAPEKSPQEKAKEYFAQAMDHYNKGEIKAAESLFAFVLKQTPEDAASKFYLGLMKTYGQLTRVEGAKIAEEALRKDPYHPEWFLAYAKQLKRMGQGLRAKKIIEEGIKANPMDFTLGEFLKGSLEAEESRQEGKSGGFGLFGKKSE